MCEEKGSSTNSYENEEYKRTLYATCMEYGGDIKAIRDKNFQISQIEQILEGLKSGIDVELYLDPKWYWYQMREIRRALEDKVDILPYIDKFDWMQLGEIRKGLVANIDVSIYADIKYVAEQMRQIKKGLISKVDVSHYLLEKYDWFQMEEIRKGLEENIDVTIYEDPKNEYMLMRQLRLALAAGIDVMPYIDKGYRWSTMQSIRHFLQRKIDPTPYLKAGYDDEQLEQIYNSFVKEVNIIPYLSVQMRGVQLEEIITGLENNIDISLYAKPEYNWKQMKQIRIGLENRINPIAYANVNFSSIQMEEIRKALEDGLDVSGYAKLMYAATDMRIAREKQLAAVEGHEEQSSLPQVEEVEENSVVHISGEVFISPDSMQAQMKVDKPEGNTVYTAKDVVAWLKTQGISLGLEMEAIQDLLDREAYEETIIAAKGQEALMGEDGKYEYYFRTEVSKTPKVLKDGSADFRHMEYFEEISAGQVLAMYTPATMGKSGYNIRGKFFLAKKGKEQPILTGTGFSLMEDNRTYVATMTGKIDLVGHRITISKIYIFEGDLNYAKGDIHFQGDVKIRGTVSKGVTVEAGGSVEIDGVVEAATIIAGGDVLVKGGVLGGEQAFISAGGDVLAKFYENTTIEAGGDVSANYALNCEITSKEAVSIHGVKGLIVGGSVRALLGVSVQTIGNEVETKTKISVGVFEEVLEEYAKVERRNLQLQSEISIFEEGIRKYKDKYTMDELNGIPLYEKIQTALQMKIDEMKENEKIKEANQIEMNRASKAQVVVSGVAYPGTVIIIDRYALRLQEEYRGITFRRKERKVAIYNNAE